jgi:hypothetical protein
LLYSRKKYWRLFQFFSIQCKRKQPPRLVIVKLYVPLLLLLLLSEKILRISGSHLLNLPAECWSLITALCSSSLHKWSGHLGLTFLTVFLLSFISALRLIPRKAAISVTCICKILLVLFYRYSVLVSDKDLVYMGTSDLYLKK